MQTRRTVLAGLAAAGVSAPFIGRARAAERLVVRDPGGIWTDVGRAAFYEPFGKEFNLEVVGVTSALEPLSQIRTIVDSKSYIWDVALLSLQAQGILGPAGYLEEIDQTAEHIRDITALAQSKYGVSVQIYASIMAYNMEKYGEKGPQSWADFFDVPKFPGRRSLRKYPIDTLEEALLADGVALKDVYPLDLDRAFKKLDQVKPHVSVWWSTGAQTSQMTKTKEVDLVTGYNGRIQAAIDDGAPFKIVWNQGVWAPDGYAIPRGNPKAKLCQQFVQFCARPDRQAEFAKRIPYGTPNPKAYDLLPKERLEMLPTAPGRLETMLMENGPYWTANLEKVAERFNRWIVT